MKYLSIALTALMAGLVAYYVQESRIKSPQDDLVKAKNSSTAQTNKPRRVSPPDPVTKSISVSESQRQPSERPEKENDIKDANPLRFVAEVMQSEAGRTIQAYHYRMDMQMMGMNKE